MVWFIRSLLSKMEDICGVTAVSLLNYIANGLNKSSFICTILHSTQRQHDVLRAYNWHIKENQLFEGCCMHSFKCLRQ